MPADEARALEYVLRISHMAKHRYAGEYLLAWMRAEEPPPVPPNVSKAGATAVQAAMRMMGITFTGENE